MHQEDIAPLQKLIVQLKGRNPHDSLARDLLFKFKDLKLTQKEPSTYMVEVKTRNHQKSEAAAFSKGKSYGGQRQNRGGKFGTYNRDGHFDKGTLKP